MRGGTDRRLALTAAEEVLGPERQDHPTLAVAQVCLAEISSTNRRYTEAEPLYVKRCQCDEVPWSGSPERGRRALLLAKLLHATGRDQEALGLLSHANEIAHLSGNQMIAWQVAGDLMQIHASGPLAKPVQSHLLRQTGSQRPAENARQSVAFQQ